MISKQHLKFIKSLQKKKFRDQSRKFLVEGEKSVLELLQSDLKINTILVTKRFLKDHIGLIQEFSADCHEVDEDLLGRAGNLKHNDTALAIAEMPSIGTSGLKSQRILPVFDQLQDPGNLGSILRICDWYGIESIVLSVDSVDLYNPKVIQASMGSFLRVKVHYFNLTDFLATTKSRVIGTSPKGSSIYQFNWPERCILLFGNESKGLTEELIKQADYVLSIPGVGGAESLNVAVSAAVFLDNIRRGSEKGPV